MGIHSSISIRQAFRDEAGSISLLVLESARLHIASQLSATGAENLLSQMDAASIETYFEKGFEFYVAEKENDLLAVGAIRPPTHLYYLFVDSANQGAGIGRSLWQVIVERIREKNTHSPITVNSSPNAIDFYQTLGFERDGDEQIKNDVRFQPMIWRADLAKPS